LTRNSTHRLTFSFVTIAAAAKDCNYSTRCQIAGSFQRIKESIIGVSVINDNGEITVVRNPFESSGSTDTFAQTFLYRIKVVT